jgi:hypothetical protein
MCAISVRGKNIFMEAADENGATKTRQSGKIAVNFTERVFPTPVRESTKELEDEVSGFCPLNYTIFDPLSVSACNNFVFWFYNSRDKKVFSISMDHGP